MKERAFLSDISRAVKERVNYDLLMEEIIKKERQSGKKTLLMHACCAPCATECINRVREVFDVTLLFYNPNIDSKEEYDKRANEVVKLCSAYGVPYVIEDYRPNEFYSAAEGVESEPEGGARCLKCFALRLNHTASLAAERGFDYFATTLTVSPHKSAAAVNGAGYEAEKLTGVRFLPADFKKKGGYLSSCNLSRELGLYRQNYCGCRYSLR